MTYGAAKPSGPLVVFAGGGSGGHLYPALAVAEQIRAREPRAHFAFFGTQRPIEHRILSELDCEFIPQDLPGLSKKPWHWPRILAGLRRSVRRCRSFFKEHGAAVVVGTGGHASVPAVREAHRMGVPTALFNPDAIPGKANRHLAPLVNVVFTQWAETSEYLPRRVPVEAAGCPVRSEFNEADRTAGLDRFGLDPKLKTLLVTGASQGARSVNRALLAMPNLRDTLHGWQVLHLTGEQDYATVDEAYRGRAVRAVVVDYTDYMAEALAAADLVVSRAGASTLAEITAVGRAAVLMPYPFHRDRHQTANARCLVRASAARVLNDAVGPAVNGPALREVIVPLMRDDDAREAMAAAARRIGRGNAASVIAERLLGLTGAPTLGACTESVEAVC